MTTKGTFTEIKKHDDKTVVVRRRVMYTDGYDAWLCIFQGYGETDKRSGKGTSVAFTYNQDTREIYLSEGFRTPFLKETVHDRTVDQFVRAGQLLEQEVKLTWLTERAIEVIQEKYLDFQKKGQENAEEEVLSNPYPEGLNDGEVNEEGQAPKRYRCKDCGRLKPISRNKCPKCKGTNFEEVV